MNSKNTNVSNLDPGQMYNRIFDDKKDAFRVSVVEGVTLNAENIHLPELQPTIIKEIEYREIKIPVIVKELQIERIEVPIIVKEYATIEKPVITKEIQIVEIEKPIIIKETQIQIIEKTISEVPLIAKVCMIVQALALVGMLLTKTL